REKLEAAVNVCRFLERNFGPRLVAGRLALLYRRLGQEEEAARYEARHLLAYRSWMHRPSFAEVVPVATRRFLPLGAVRSIRFVEHELPPHPSAAQRAPPPSP